MLIPLKDACSKSGLKYHMLYKMVRDGRLQATQPGGENSGIYVDEDDLKRVLKEGCPVRRRNAKAGRQSAEQREAVRLAEGGTRE